MELVRELPDLVHNVPRAFLQPGQLTGEVGRARGGAVPQRGQGDRERAELLVHAVVELAGNAAALLLLGGDQPAGQGLDLRGALVDGALRVLPASALAKRSARRRSRGIISSGQRRSLRAVPTDRPPTTEPCSMRGTTAVDREPNHARLSRSIGASSGGSPACGIRTTCP